MTLVQNHLQQLNGNRNYDMFSYQSLVNDQLHQDKT